jgi:peptide/nickel transport system permease protein
MTQNVKETHESTVSESANTASTANIPQFVVTNRSRLGSIKRLIRKWPVLSIVILSLLVIAGVFANWVAPQDPYAAVLVDRLDAPVWYPDGTFEHILGVDHLGRDVLSRIIHGASVSLIISLSVISVAATLGTFLGMAAGYFGGWIDDIVMRVVELMISIPLLLIAMMASVVYGSSLTLLVVVLSLFSWPGFARQVRAEVLRLRTTDYVLIAKMTGASPTRIFAKHLLPGVLNTVIVLATLLVGSVILSESILSFLGAGVPPPRPAWGSMVSEGRDFVTIAPWIMMFPGIAIFTTVLGFNFLGDWLRDYFDPRLRQID